MHTQALHAGPADERDRTRQVRRTGRLLLAGAAGGPLFTTLALGQALTRDGFHLRHQPLSLLGVGLVAGGIFVPDPALGYPPGTPDAIPVTFSWHGLAHAVAPPFAFAALMACCFVLARRFAAVGHKTRALCSVATGVLALVLTAWPGVDGASIRLAVAVFLGLAWTTFVALDLRRAT